MLNIRGLRNNSHFRLNEGGTLPALAVILVSLLTFSFAAMCSAANRANIIESGQDSTPVSERRAESSGQLVAVWSSSGYTEAAQVSPLDFNDWRNQNKVFEHMAAFVGGRLELRKGGRREKIPRTSVSSGFFEVLGARPFLGRVFTLADEESGRDDIVILSYALWQRHFGSDLGIVGKKVSFNTEEFTVVGVMPKGFEYPGKSDLPSDFRYQSHTETWTPLAINSMRLGRGFRFLSVIARMRPSVTISDARRDMEAISDKLQQQNSQTNKGWGVRLVALRK